MPKLSQLAASTVLSGSEYVAGVQGGVAVRIPVLDIANLGGGGGGASGADADTLLAISQSIEEYSTTRTIGVMSPTTGTGAAASTFVYNTKFEEDGEIIEFGYFGVNSGGVGAARLRVFSWNSPNFTMASNNAYDVAAGILNIKSVANGGMTAPIPVFKDQYWGTYSQVGAGVPGAKIPYVSSGTGGGGYWETAGDQTGTFAKGTFVTGKAMQCYIVVRYASGRIAKLLNSMAAQNGFTAIYGKHNAETFATGTDILTTSSTQIVPDPRPFPWAGPILQWKVNVQTPGGTPAQLMMFLIEVGDDGHVVDIYCGFRKMCVNGVNTFSRADGTLPEIYSRKARRCFPAYLCQTTGAKVLTTDTGGDNTIPSAGYGLSCDITGDLLGANVFNYNTSDTRIDHQIMVQAIRPSVANKVIYDRKFGGSVRPWDVKGASANLVFGATGVKIANGAFGMGKGVVGIVEEALNKSRVTETVTLGAYDSAVVGKRLTLGNYGTAVEMDVATNTLNVRAISGNALGTVLATKTAPFSTPMVEGDVITCVGVRDDRAFHLSVFRANVEMAQFTSTSNITTNASPGAKSNAAIIADTAAQGTTLTMDLNAWADETDLARMGMWCGVWFFASNRSTPVAWATGAAKSVGNMVTESGNVYYCITAHTAGTFATDLAAGKWGLWSSSELNYVLHDSEVLDATDGMLVDSMGDSRATFNLSWFGLLRTKVAALGRKMMLNAVHGASCTSHRIHFNRLSDYMDRLENMILGAGMNDTQLSNPSADLSVITTQVNHIVYQAIGRGIRWVICDVFLTFVTGGPANNDGNLALTGVLRALAVAIGAPSVTFKDTASASGAGLLRNEAWHNASSDAHLSPSFGHYAAAKQTALQGGRVLNITPVGIPTLIYP